MAIKIIKNTMKEPIEMECENCKSVFEYNYQDIKVRDRSGLFGIEYRDRFVTCPVCKFDNIINKSNKMKTVESDGNIAQNH